MLNKLQSRRKLIYTIAVIITVFCLFGILSKRKADSAIEKLEAKGIATSIHDISFNLTSIDLNDVYLTFKKSNVQIKKISIAYFGNNVKIINPSFNGHINDYLQFTNNKKEISKESNKTNISMINGK